MSCNVPNILCIENPTAILTSYGCLGAVCTYYYVPMEILAIVCGKGFSEAICGVTSKCECEFWNINVCVDVCIHGPCEFGWVQSVT